MPIPNTLIDHEYGLLTMKWFSIACKCGRLFTKFSYAYLWKSENLITSFNTVWYRTSSAAESCLSGWRR